MQNFCIKAFVCLLLAKSIYDWLKAFEISPFVLYSAGTEIWELAKLGCQNCRYGIKLWNMAWWITQWITATVFRCCRSGMIRSCCCIYSCIEMFAILPVFPCLAEKKESIITCICCFLDKLITIHFTCSVEANVNQEWTSKN